jgi:hypothetical protein
LLTFFFFVTARRWVQVMVWEVDALRRPDRPVALSALHTLTGHDDAVTCVAASPMLDLVVSASQVGTPEPRRLSWEGVACGVAAAM